MTHEEIISYLKSNTTIYDLWPKEVRKVADGIERKWWQVRRCGEFIYLLIDTPETLGDLNDWESVYRLSPDYHPPKKAGWVEYDVVCNDYGEYVTTGVVVFGTFLASGLRTLAYQKGFGGVMYEDCECNDLKAYHPEPWFMSPPAPCSKHGPHKPIKVRFWKEK